MSLDSVLLARRWPERRAVVVAVAATGFAAVFAGASAADDPAMAISVLYVLPVVLVALELGLAVGLAASAFAVALVIAGDLLAHPGLEPLGVATRSVAFAVAGAIAGRFSDRMRAMHAREQRLLDSGLALGEVGAYDRLPGVVAGAARRTPGAVGAVVELDGAPVATRGRTDGDRTEADIAVRGVRLGRVAVVHDAPLRREDHAALELLALQAGLAAENHRLLAHQRVAAALEAELCRARDDLLEQRSGLAQLLHAQEDDRRRVAEALHEELAQVLAAVLLGLRMLRREEPAAGAGSLDDLHAQVVGVLDEVRDMATALRPSSLGQLGLVPALEALAHNTGGTLSVQAGAVPDPLPEPLRTGAYRMVEQAVSATRPGGRVDLRLSATQRRLDLDLELDVDGSTEALAGARARAALLDGSVETTPSGGGRTRMRVRLPIPAAAHKPSAAAGEPTGRLARTTVHPTADSMRR